MNRLKNFFAEKHVDSFIKSFRSSCLVDYFLLGGIILIGVGIRYFQLAGNLYSDEIWIITTATSSFSNFVYQLTQDWVHPPLFHFLARGWIHLFGLSDLSGRLISMTFGVLSIPLIYWLGKQISGGKAGLVAAALLALSPPHIYNSQYGRHYSLFIFFVLLSIASFLKVCSQPSNRNSIFYCLSNILLVYTHYFGWLIVFCQVLFFLIRRTTFLQRWILLQTVILISYIPWIFIVLKTATQTGFSPYIDWIKPISLLEPLNTLSEFNGTLPISHQRKLSLLLLGGVSLLSFKDFFTKNTKYKEDIIFLLSCVFIPFITVFIISLTVKPIWILRVMLLSVPAYYLLISIGTQQVKSKNISFFLMLIPIVWMAFASLTYIRSDHRMPYEKIARYLERESGKGVPILVENSYIMNPLCFYYRGQGILHELNSRFSSVIPLEHRKNLSQVLSRKRETVLILVTYTGAERDMQSEFLPNYFVFKQQEFFGYGEEGQLRKVSIVFYKKRDVV